MLKEYVELSQKTNRLIAYKTIVQEIQKTMNIQSINSIKHSHNTKSINIDCIMMINMVIWTYFVVGMTYHTICKVDCQMHVGFCGGCTCGMFEQFAQGTFVIHCLSSLKTIYHRYLQQSLPYLFDYQMFVS